MAAVISDTSVWHYLSVTGQLNVLPKLFGDILIPPAVWKEVSHHPELLVHRWAKEAVAAGWLKVEAPADVQTVKFYLQFLGSGESEAIVLAKERQPGLVPMDDLEGRLTAQQLNLSVMGTVGVLVRARKENLAVQLKPLLDELINTHRFRLERKLYLRALSEVEESE